MQVSRGPRGSSSPVAAVPFLSSSAASHAAAQSSFWPGKVLRSVDSCWIQEDWMSCVVHVLRP